MGTPTYTALANVTLSSASSSVTFSSISQAYRDLILVGSGTFNDNAIVKISFGSTFTGVRAYGYSGTTFSNGLPDSSAFWLPVGTSLNNFQFQLQIFDYAESKDKVAVCRAGNTVSSGLATYKAATSSAVTSISITQNSMWQFEAGSTFALYGIVS